MGAMLSPLPTAAPGPSASGKPGSEVPFAAVGADPVSVELPVPTAAAPVTPASDEPGSDVTFAAVSALAPGKAADDHARL